MGLQFQLDSLDAVDEAFKSLYTETDGKFQLEVEGIPAPEDTTALKTALQKERLAAKNAQKSLSGFTTLYETPDEIQAAIDAAREDAGGKDPKESKEFQLLQGKLDKATADYEALTGGIAKANGSAARVIRNSALQAALVEAKATPSGMRLLANEYSGRVKVTVNDDGTHEMQLVQSDGETPMIGSGADGSATIADLLKDEAIKSYPELFQGSGAGGSGKQPGSGGSGGNSKKWNDLSGAEKVALHRTNPEEYQRVKDAG